MPDTFALTILFIVVCTVVGAFLKGRAKDRCLADFSRYPVFLQKNSGKVIWGVLGVEHSCVELVYEEPYLDKTDGHLEASYILYRNEYGNIYSLVRYVDALTADKLAARDETLARARKPGFFLKASRKTRNVFGTVRDSLMEAVNLFVGRIRSATPAGKLLTGQDKYVSQLQQQMVSTLATSYEPVLERYLGKKVVLSVVKDGVKSEFSGVLKDYTPEFIEVLDVDYKGPADNGKRKADIIVLRSIGMVRHAGGAG